jgi:hypothetical protein
LSSETSDLLLGFVFDSPAEKLELDQSELFEMGATGVEEVDEA